MSPSEDAKNNPLNEFKRASRIVKIMFRPF